MDHAKYFVGLVSTSAYNLIYCYWYFNNSYNSLSFLGVPIKICLHNLYQSNNSFFWTFFCNVLLNFMEPVEWSLAKACLVHSSLIKSFYDKPACRFWLLLALLLLSEMEEFYLFHNLRVSLLVYAYYSINVWYWF